MSGPVSLRDVELCESPVFIIGSPRSGTTGLAHALGRHPELWVSKESYFLHQLFGNGRAGSVWHHNWERATPSWLRVERVERPEFLEALGIGMNALFSSRSGGRRWVDQTPLYTLMAEDLAHMFPGAKFVHIVRDGRAVVRSMGSFMNVFSEAEKAAITDEVPAWVQDFELACETWRSWVDTALSFAAAHPARAFTIRNEDLARDPEPGFSRIFDFLGIGEDGGPAAQFGGSRVNSSFAAPLDVEGWSPEQRRTFREVAGETLVRAGCATTSELDEWDGALR